MFVSTDQLPAHSRVWVYQSNRLLTTAEMEKINILGKAFTDSWTSHDFALKAGFEIRYNAFLIFMIDERQASAGGCSIDKSVHFIQKIEKDFSVTLMDRMIFAYKKDNGAVLLKRNDFEAAIEKGEIYDDTIVFNNLVQSKQELDNKWELPLRDSWLRSLLVSL